jgi:hypothetical protein
MQRAFNPFVLLQIDQKRRIYNYQSNGTMKSILCDVAYDKCKSPAAYFYQTKGGGRLYCRCHNHRIRGNYGLSFYNILTKEMFIVAKVMET